MKIIWRNLIRNKTFSAINIIGLAIGMTCVILITLWVFDELSFDSFHSSRDNIYRIYHYVDDFQERDIETPAPLGPVVQDEIPEITDYVRYTGAPRIFFQYNSQVHYEDRVVFADGSLFDMFSFQTISGDPKSLEEPLNIFISESIAQKYFGEKNPLDKVLMIEGQYPGTVKGIFQDVPQNSSLDFNVVISFNLTEHIGMDHCWGCFNFATYVRLADNSNVDDVIAKINRIASEEKCPQVIYDKVKFYLQPLSEIHLDAAIEYEDEADLIKLGNKTYVYIFSIVAILILVLACINFINLSTAQSISRFKNIGIKKTIGAGKIHIIRQSIGESLFLEFFALLIASLLIKIGLPVFNKITDKNMLFNLLDYKVLLILGIVYIITGLLAGFYPAYFLSAFKPVTAIAGRGFKNQSKKNLRITFITFQFTIAIALIISILIIYKQLSYIQNKNLGFNKENLVYLPVRGEIAEKYDLLKTELLRQPEIISVTIKNSLPMASMNNTSDLECDGKRPGENVYFETTSVGYDYFETLQLHIKNGRTFSQELPTDSYAYILNDEAVRLLNLKNPIGRQFRLYDKRGPIIGVVESANFRSLHQRPRPRVYYFMRDKNEADITGVVLIRIATGNIQKTITNLNELWKSINRQIPFEFGFLDQAINNQYQYERKVKTIFNYFTIFVLIVSALGLFGLALFSTEQRIKEIGIRKTNGAKSWQIIYMLSKEFTRWVILAFIIASPIALYAMNKWLQNFAYKTTLSWWIFALAGILALGIALLTVSWQSWRAATRNPVEALRYE